MNNYYQFKILIKQSLQEHDASALALSQKTGDLQKDIEARNTYEENIKEFNNAAGHQPRSALILGKNFKGLREVQFFLQKLKLVYV